mgnify:CR=1 FL=1
MARFRTRRHYKILVDNIIEWLNADIDKLNHNDNKEIQDAIAHESYCLKEKIELYLEGQDEF